MERLYYLSCDLIKTMEEKTYTFINITGRENVLDNKEIRDYLMKWSMKGNLSVQYYSFNQTYHAHRRDKFVTDFFQSAAVYSTFLYNETAIGKPASSVSIESIPCTVLSMDFFDRLLEPENSVVQSDRKSIVQCQEDDVDGFVVDDNLRNMILNNNSKRFNIFSESDRKQFIWRLFCHLCLGGEWCQYEFSIEPYLTATKFLYKNLISVQRIDGTSDLVIRSVVLKVEVYDEDKKRLVPLQLRNCQDFVYIIIDPFKRSVIVLTHRWGGSFYY